MHEEEPVTSTQPRRIVSLLPSATEIVAELGLADQLVGISHACNWPPQIRSKPRLTRSNVDSSADSARIDQEVRAKLEAESALFSLDVKRLAALAPDVILTQAQCDVCAIRHDEVLRAVAEHRDLRTTEVFALHPISLDEVLNNIVQIGDLVGRADAGRAYRQRLQNRIERVAQRVPHGRRPRALVIEWTDPVMIAGNWTPQLVEAAGGTYGLAAAGRRSRYASWEKIVQFAPEVIIVAPCGLGLERALAETREMAKRPEWKSLPAVAAGRVHAVDGDAYFNQAGPRLVDSLELAAGWLSASSA